MWPGKSYAEATSYDYLTLKYSSTGKLLWKARYNGPGNGTDSAVAVTVDSDGNVYVLGSSEGSSSRPDFATIKYSPAGSELWVKRYNGPGNGADTAAAMALDGKGNLYVTGTSYGGVEAGDDFATIKYRAANGRQLWVRRFDGGTSSAEGWEERE